MPIATPEVYAEMIDRAKAGKFAYPAVNITSSQTVTAAIQDAVYGAVTGDTAPEDALSSLQSELEEIVG